MMKPMISRDGQTALILALVVAVGMTVAVSIASRSVTTVSIGIQEEERSRSFSAAEAGVEDALRRNLSGLVGSTIPTISLGGSSVGYSVTQRSSLATVIDPGTIITIDWTKSAATSVTVNWTVGSCTPWLIGTTISMTGGVTHVADNSRSRGFSKSGNRTLRLRFTQCSTTVTLTGNGGNLSFYLVDALGASGEAKTRVQVTRAEPAALGLLDFAVFSGGAIQ